MAVVIEHVRAEEVTLACRVDREQRGLHAMAEIPAFVMARKIS